MVAPLPIVKTKNRHVLRCIESACLGLTISGYAPIVGRYTERKGKMEITEVKIYPFDTTSYGGRTKAFAEITIDGILTIRGLRVVEAKSGGLFVMAFALGPAVFSKQVRNLGAMLSEPTHRA